MAGGGSHRPDGIIDGINVTPLVDITLVLLVVFMVTAKMIVTPAVPLDLPPSTHAAVVQTILSVAVPSDGTIHVENQVLTDAQLTAKARQLLAENPELRAVIEADGSVPHRRVIAVLDALKDGGLTRVAFGAVARHEVGDGE